MENREKTFTVQYKAFDVGEVVSPCSSRCGIPDGQYIVTKFIEPLMPDSDAVVYLEGHKYGVSTNYLELAIKPPLAIECEV